MAEHMVENLQRFFCRVGDDYRIGTSHISIYMVLFYWNVQRGEHPVYFFGQQLRDLAKVSRRTYSQTMRELETYGYITYVPSCNPALGSLVYLNEIMEQEHSNKKAGH